MFTNLQDGSGSLKEVTEEDFGKLIKLYSLFSMIFINEKRNHQVIFPLFLKCHYTEITKKTLRLSLILTN